MNRLARWGRGLGSRPAAQLALAGFVVALAFPGTAEAVVGRAIVFAVLGIAAASWWPHAPAWLRRPPRAVATTLVLLAVAAVGLYVFWDTLTVSPDWQMGDWGPQQAVLHHVMPSLPGLHAPVWNHAIGTGDAPLELYPALTYLITGHLARLLGLQHDLPLAFMIVAVMVHVGIAVCATAMAARVAPRPVALVLGLLLLCDAGALTQGGTSGLFRWGVLHSEVAEVFSLIASLGVLAALERPRLGASVVIWLGTALAMASHPSAILLVGASVVALLATAAFASDVPPRRALAAIGHLAIGVALAAVVWVPTAQRIYLYGQVYANELLSSTDLLHLVLRAAVPASTFAFVCVLGFVGALASPFARRAAPLFIGGVAVALVLGMTEGPYRAMGILASPGVARLGAIRMMMIARPFVYAAAAFALALVARACRGAWARAAARDRVIAAAVLGATVGWLVGTVPSFWHELSEDAAAQTRVLAPEPAARAQLVAWARTQEQSLGPGRWARALFEEDTHEYLHLTAETGLPTLQLGPIPDALLRERIEDASPASLARFDVRWVIGVGHSPKLGDAKTEIVFGPYHIREVPGWDGRFARVERGSGQVTTTRLDDRAVEVDLEGTTQPALVVLGTGYYPRWRARHADGTREPVYAYPSIPGGSLHVVAAWVKPGRTTFTVDGPLPSDGHGRVLSLLAALAALAAIVIWTRPRWRTRVLRQVARGRRATSGWPRRAVAWTPALALLLIALAWRASLAPAAAFSVGDGLRALATVEARAPSGAWQPCAYTALRGAYECDGLATVRDGTANVLDDAPPSWPFMTPGVLVVAKTAGVEVRITRTLALAGRYWAQAAGGSATLKMGSSEVPLADRLELTAPDGDLTLVFTVKPPPEGNTAITFVAEAALEPPRPFLAGPPDTPPPDLR